MKNQKIVSLATAAVLAGVTGVTAQNQNQTVQAASTDGVAKTATATKSAAETAVTKATTDVKTATDQVGQAQNDLNAANKDQTAASDKLNDAQNQVTDAETDLNQAETNKAAATEDGIKQAEADVSTAKDQQTAAQNKADATDKNFADKQNEVDEKTANKTAAAKAVTDQEKVVADAENKVKEAQSVLLKSIPDELANELTKVQNDISNDINTINQNKISRENILKLLEKDQNEIKSIQQKLQTISEKINNGNIELNTYKTTIEKIQTNIQDIQNKLDQEENEEQIIIKYSESTKTSINTLINEYRAKNGFHRDYIYSDYNYDDSTDKYDGDGYNDWLNRFNDVIWENFENDDIKYIPSEEDQKDVVDANNVTDKQLLELNLFGAQVANKMREQIGENPTFQVSDVSIKLAGYMDQFYNDADFDAVLNNALLDPFYTEEMFDFSQFKYNNVSHYVYWFGVRPTNSYNEETSTMATLKSSLFDYLTTVNDWNDYTSIFDLDYRKDKYPDYFVVGVDKFMNFQVLTKSMSSGTSVEDPINDPNPSSTESFYEIPAINSGVVSNDTEELYKTLNEQKSELQKELADQKIAQSYVDDLISTKKDLVDNSDTIKEKIVSENNDLQSVNNKITVETSKLSENQKISDSINKKIELLMNNTNEKLNLDKAKANLTSETQILQNLQNTVTTAQADLDNATANLFDAQGEADDAVTKLADAKQAVADAEQYLDDLQNADENLAAAQQVLTQAKVDQKLAQADYDAKVAVVKQATVALKDAQTQLATAKQTLKLAETKLAQEQALKQAVAEAAKKAETDKLAAAKAKSNNGNGVVQAATLNQSKLPQASENNKQAGWLVLVGASLLSLFGLGTLNKKRRS
ncbi:hypothetical protein [Lapidilactobacillus wuchangensis]|uniref:hypothetical protein n=1 Tax=Lapidilactobacillus wuchangensis TaxID=2486001 RepID=UPI000F7B87B1|nr:hypothetical protein [Lapidilactobacillus wuchangensis]